MSAQERYSEFTEGCEPLSPIEALRFFCSLTMHGQDWLDVEKFFDAVESELSAAKQKLEAAEASIKSWQEQTVTAESAIIRLGDLLERICDIVKGRAPEGESYSYHDLPEELTKRLAEANSKAVPEGWQLVPKEPTKAMYLASLDMSGVTTPTPRGRREFISIAYHAMLAAATQPEIDRGSNE